MDGMSSTIERHGEIAVIFNRAESEEFQTGYDSILSRQLTAAILDGGPRELHSIELMLLNEGHSNRVKAEVLKILGDLVDLDSHLKRYFILEAYLFCVDSSLRDAALIGISCMNDPIAIPALERAMITESIPELRRDIRSVLVELKE